MKVSVMMAFVCNPYLAILQKRLYLRYWKGEVDQVLISVNGRNDKIRKFIMDLWKDEKVIIDEVPSEIRQGVAFDRLYLKATGDIIITMDSDNFVYQKGVLKEYSDKVYRGEFGAIGSIGYHAWPSSVSKKILDKFGTVRLNPFLSFWKKSLMDETYKENPGLNFGTYNYGKGDFFKPIGSIDAKGWMDIMAKFTLLYFSKCPKYLPIKQILDGRYFHVGALSSIYRRNFRYLEDKNDIKYVGQGPRKQPVRYLAWDKYISDITQNELNDQQFNEEHEKGFNVHIEKDLIDGNLNEEYKKIKEKFDKYFV